MSRVLYCLSSQLPRIMAALIRSALSAIIRGMLTADRPDKRRQETRGSQPATVVRRRDGRGDEGKQWLGAEGFVVGVAIMVDYGRRIAVAEIRDMRSPGDQTPRDEKFETRSRDEISPDARTRFSENGSFDVISFELRFAEGYI
eukprot:scaffold2242_cov57-Cyclotella_meneghiniana.AAC.4